MGRASKRAVVISDFHCPSHSRPWVRCLTQSVIPDLDPDVMVLAGDMLTCAGLGKWAKSPDAPRLQDERESFAGVMQALRDAAPRARLVYLEGNHERRLLKKLWADPSLYGVPELTWPALLDLERYHCEWREEEDILRLGPIAVKHAFKRGVNMGAGYTAANVLRRIHSHAIQGHTHRLAVFRQSGVSGTLQVAESGCGADWRAENYLSNHPDWQIGAIVAEYTETAQNCEMASIAWHGDHAACGTTRWGVEVRRESSPLCSGPPPEPLEQLEQQDPTPPGYLPEAVLRLLSRGPMTVNALADSLGLDAGDMTDLIDNLAVEGHARLVAPSAYKGSECAGGETWGLA